MRILVITAATALAALAPLAHAQYDHDRSYDRDRGYYQPIPDSPPPAPAYRGDDERYGRGEWADTHARVIDSQPVYAQGGSHEECWNEESHRYDRRDRVAGTALGALAGGVIGHQFGGSDRGTAAGAIVGGIVGNQVARNRDENRPAENDQRCRTVTDNSTDVIGYDVRYEYRGQQFNTRLDHDPGRWLAVGQDIGADGNPIASSGYAAPPDYDRR
jgi:uncharacterized protein YcfJ